MVKHSLTGIVHSGTKGSKTACGEDTTRPHSDHWVNTSEKVTCRKNGCRK